MTRNDGCDYRERLGADVRGVGVLAYLAARYPHSPAAAWRERLEAGHVWLDGEPARPDTILAPGRILLWRRPPWEEPDAPLAFDVVYRDEDVLAVAKPAGLPTLPGAGFLQATLLHQVLRADPGAVPVHRLGRWTSGIVLFARSRSARAALSRQFAARAVGKRYRALAVGDPGWDERAVDVPIGPVPHARLGTLHAASPSGRPAHSRITVLERRGGAFLCDVRITTGRPHQIRIHLAAAGHPLAGDPLYGAGGVPAPDAVAVPGDGGYHLHAAEVSFSHPRTARPVTLSCAPPSSSLSCRT